MKNNPSDNNNILPEMNDYIQSIVSEGINKIFEIFHESEKIHKDEIRLTMKNICIKGKNILRAIENNPTHYSENRQLFTYYFDAIASIVKKYNSVSNQSNSPSDTLTEAEKMLQQFESLLNNVYDKIQNTSSYDLQQELIFLKKIMHLE